MIPALELVVVDSAGQPATDCDVCGSEIEAGKGLTARSGGRTLRFKCAGCLARFRADPKQFLSGRGLPDVLPRVLRRGPASLRRSN